VRLDKFLKVSRLVKRRTLAKEVADAHRVLINNRPAKPGSEVKVGDSLTLDFGRRIMTVTILILRESASTADARLMYEVTKEEVREDW
jgi:ribosomal 50S subunit-recycling heat shock protein